MRNMGGLRSHMPWTFALMGIATLAIAGIPPFSGFFSKDEILASAFARGGDNALYYVYWALGLAAAAITAFYMARLMAMTFLGNNRTGDAERGHLHEAPWTMTGPLVVLGILSLTGGVINLPSFVGGHHALETWLEPVTEQAHAFVAIHLPHGTTEAWLIAAAVAIALVGLIWGTRATMAADIVPAVQAEEERGFWRVLYHK